MIGTIAWILDRLSGLSSWKLSKIAVIKVTVPERIKKNTRKKNNGLQQRGNWWRYFSFPVYSCKQHFVFNLLQCWSGHQQSESLPFKRTASQKSSIFQFFSEKVIWEYKGVLHGKVFDQEELMIRVILAWIQKCKLVYDKYMSSDNPSVCFRIVACSLYTCHFALKNYYHQKP